MDYKDLEGLPLIMLDGKSSTRDYVDSFLRDNEVNIQPEFELATSDMIVQFTLRNLGVGCVVKSFAKEYLESGVLFESVNLMMTGSPSSRVSLLVMNSMLACLSTF